MSMKRKTSDASGSEDLATVERGRKKGHTGCIRKPPYQLLSFRSPPQAMEKAHQFPGQDLWMIPIKHSADHTYPNYPNYPTIYTMAYKNPEPPPNKWELRT